MSVHVLRKVYWHTSVKYCIAKHLFRSKSLYILRAFIFNSCFFVPFSSTKCCCFLFDLFNFHFFILRNNNALCLYSRVLVKRYFLRTLIYQCRCIYCFYSKNRFYLEMKLMKLSEKMERKKLNCAHTPYRNPFRSGKHHEKVWIAKLNEYKAIQ